MLFLKLRASEWIFVSFFAYVFAISPFFRERTHLGLRPALIFAAVVTLLLSLAQAERTRFANTISKVRDWVPLALMLIAFREMDFFAPKHYDLASELSWMRLDDFLLHRLGLERALESLGVVLPLYLELCYLLVYGLGVFCISALWIQNCRQDVDRFYTVYLLGTVLAYALFPYFPSEPPRLAFPNADPPAITTAFRTFNLFLLRKATIHTGVFPSAHVSSAFSAAWGMFVISPKRRATAWGLLFYAVSVAIATIYGRYHYAVDSLAGFAVSLLALTIYVLLQRRTGSRRL